MSALYILFLTAFFYVHYDKSMKGSQNVLGSTVILNIQSTKKLVLNGN